MKQVIDTIELLSSAHVTGEAVAQVLREAGHCEVEVTRLERDGLSDCGQGRAYTGLALAGRSFSQRRRNMYRHLLIAVDGSLLSESAFKKALVFAKEMNASITLLRAIPEDHLTVYQAEMLGAHQAQHNSRIPALSLTPSSWPMA
ncbi:universal stress protein [Lactiplantibacillus plantarum]|uniref:universal stress protein n=1 Tax=Lactiplantibacillus plantarum TaxID=1590 RepID=UPI004046603E